MHTKPSINLLVFLCSSFLLNVCDSRGRNNPTEEFYNDIETRPILVYQCYANGSSVDPPGTVNFTVLFDGTNSTTSVASGTLWSASKGAPNSYVRGDFQTYYDAARGVGVLTTSTATEDFTLLRSFKGESLYIKIDVTSKNNTQAYKIYDVDFKCMNAKILLRQVCPFQCNMKLTREL
ncbi:uncharacterized protein LOC115311034 [Ixodes scapularis]|uniref:uncharacterized protein LOC115311034 n=1 Tax=Ixodes scapularis TaxID=6945 RepID=UPI001A9FD454|nr:uncharacterized protein LOC115311034 [Ixodes scapularis]